MDHGKGSLLIAFDFYFDRQSALAIVLSPMRLHQEIGECIEDAGMQARDGMLDVWETMEAGPATSFYSLAESHVRMTILKRWRLSSFVPWLLSKLRFVPANFIRMETWPVELQANGEVQLCNFSRDNTHTAQMLASMLIETLNPAKAYLMLIKRGPDIEPYVYGKIRWERGMNYIPFLHEVRQMAERQAAE